jgi:hypothetical protein
MTPQNGRSWRKRKGSSTTLSPWRPTRMGPCPFAHLTETERQEVMEARRLTTELRKRISQRREAERALKEHPQMKVFAEAQDIFARIAAETQAKFRRSTT